MSLENAPALASAWQRTQTTIANIRQRLTESELDSRIVTVAISGSLGRMEQVGLSDADLLVVTDRQHLGTAERRVLVESVWAAIGELKLPPPKSTGIYAEAATWPELVGDADLGRIDESPKVFGQRIQLLLDSQPAYHDDVFVRLQHAILLRYGSADVVDDVSRTGAWRYLLDDLVRYYRCLSLDARWQRRDNSRKWHRARVKFEHSRRVLFAGLLLPLMCANGQPTDVSIASRVDRLARELRLTPLERTAMACASFGHPVERILFLYNRFLTAMSKDECHVASGNGQDLAEELTCFVFAIHSAMPAALRGVLF